MSQSCNNHRDNHRNSRTHYPKPLLLSMAVAACFSTGAIANPTAPTVVNGTASFNQAGNVLTVTNSNGAAINWNSFSIAAGETTRFVQPSASSSVLNRVLGGDPSNIYGTLSSNGRVWLVNPAGIMVGPSGRIDVAGFVASTLHVSTADFLANKLGFNATPGAGNVVNQGEITTPSGGAVYLVGTHVTNEGIITTPQGETILAAGQTVSLIDTATPGVKVEITGAAGDATNLGTIVADAGRIGIAGVIVRNSGTLNASSAVSEGGRIFLRASQDAYVDGNGRIITTGTTGGRVEVLGERVAVMDNASIDASGVNGGGTILVGGDYQGKNPAIQNASVTYFGPDATLKADAQNLGAGGTVIVWADDTTRAYGTISARGGANGGDGGFVETSGKRYLAVDGIRVDTRAPHGTTGSWLLDPDELTLVEGSGVDVGIYGGPVFTTTSASSTIYSDGIETALSTTNVTLQTGGGGGNGSITATGVTINNGTAAYGLTLAAYGGGSATGDINITNSSFYVYGGVTLLAGWNGGGYTSADVISGKGDINIQGSTIHSGGGAVNLWAGHSIAASGATFSTVGGNITLQAYGGITASHLITSGDAGATGADGGVAGNVSIHSYGGDINVTSIAAVGGQGGDESSISSIVGAGGDGGQVTLTAAGAISIDNIDASGGNGGSALASNTGGSGGDGGNITLTATGAVTATNGMYARGGNGGAGGGAGGMGGALSIQGASINLSGYGYSVDGGSGGIGDGFLGWDGGSGGDAGSMTLTATAGGIDLSNAWLAALGGAGGDGADGVDNTYGPTAGGGAGHGGNISLTANGLVSVSNGSIHSSGGVGGRGGDDAAGSSLGHGADGGDGGTAGHILIDAGQITLTDSWLAARGGDGGQGGNGYGHGNATYTVTVGGTDLCGGSASATCHGQLITGSYGGVAYSFYAPTDQTDSTTTTGGIGGAGGSVDDASGLAIMLKAHSGDIMLSNTSSGGALLDFGTGFGGIGGENGGTGPWPLYAGPTSTFIGSVTVVGDDIPASQGVYDARSSWGSQDGVSGRLMLAATGNLSVTDGWVSGSGYTGSQRIDFLAGWNDVTDGSGVPTGVVGATGDIVLNNTDIYAPSSGTLALTAGGNITFGTSTINAWSSTVTLNAGGYASLGRIDAPFGGSITINAGGAILDGNGSAVNLKAGTVNLTSAYGGSSSGLAISADIDNSDTNAPLSTLNATVDSSASYGGISLRVVGDAPTNVNLSDGAASQSSLYLSATRDILINSGYTLSTTGNETLAAGRDLLLDSYLWGSSGSTALTKLTAVRNLSIGSSGSLNASGDVQLKAATITNTGGVSAGNNLTMIANSITGTGSAYFQAGNNLNAVVANNIALLNGAYFRAVNDINLALAGAGSTVSMTSGSYMLANSPDTIHIDFATRTAGGIFINGVETTTNASDGTGFFVGYPQAPAVPGAGLEITYANAANPANPAILAIFDSNSGQAGETEEERQRRLQQTDDNGESNDPADKPVAQCS